MSAIPSQATLAVTTVHVSASPLSFCFLSCAFHVYFYHLDRTEPQVRSLRYLNDGYVRTDCAASQYHPIVQVNSINYYRP